MAVLATDVTAAFLAGVASILGAGWSLRRAHREEREQCDKRVREIREMYDQGIEKGLHMSERDA